MGDVTVGRLDLFEFPRHSISRPSEPIPGRARIARAASIRGSSGSLSPTTAAAASTLVKISRMTSWSCDGPMLIWAVEPSGAMNEFSGEVAGPDTSSPVTGSFTSQSR